ncbi:hypothetical protein ACVMB0_004121 [Bradyrhizobium sp. USDA 4451]
MTTKADRAVNRTGVYLALLQLVFTLGWTTYLIYLPKLCAEVGIAPSTVILILMMDQAIFTITDTAMGMAADRISVLVGPARPVRRHPRRDLLRRLHRAALCRRHRAGRKGLADRADRDLGRDVVGVARAAADATRQVSRAAVGPVPRRAGDAGLRHRGRGLALSRRCAARS